MANKGSLCGTGSIDPNAAYTVEGAARELGVTARWFRENLIETGAIPIASLGRRGHFEMFPGYVLIKWIEKEMQECVGRDDEHTVKSS